MEIAPLSPFVPADVGTQNLSNSQRVRFIKGWIPASAGMNGDAPDRSPHE
jgi:hypothetical protein